jgi:hypothetical protein
MLDLEYYTIAQAARSLDCHEDEVEHFIQAKKIKCHLISKSRRFVFIERTENNNLAGIGVGNFEGPILPQQHFVRALLDTREKVTINKPSLIRESKKISNWSSENPFKSQQFLNDLNLAGWIGVSGFELMHVPVIYTIPLPSESPGLFKTATVLLNSIAKRRDTKPSTNLAPENYPEFTYSYWKYGEFDLANLVIMSEDLVDFRNKLLTSTHPAPSETKEPISQSTEFIELSKIRGQSRNNDLHELLFTIIQKYPEKQSRFYWNTLRRDVHEIPRKLDKDEIIVKVTKDNIHWVSAYDNEDTLSLNSFPSTISRLKGILKDHLGQN